MKAYGEVKVQLHLFIWALNGGEWSASPRRLTALERARDRSEYEIGWFSESILTFWGREKVFVLARIRPPNHPAGILVTTLTDLYRLPQYEYYCAKSQVTLKGYRLVRWRRVFWCKFASVSPQGSVSVFGNSLDLKMEAVRSTETIENFCYSAQNHTALDSDTDYDYARFCRPLCV
jgi:hypothetical protein